jgi:hypothetical protein
MILARSHPPSMHPRSLRRYLAGLSGSRLVSWCYFIWYLVVLVLYFDPTPRLWLTSLGLSLIIVTALLLNTTRSGRAYVDTRVLRAGRCNDASK